jgi:hypothetical protein
LLDEAAVALADCLLFDLPPRPPALALALALAPLPLSTMLLAEGLGLGSDAPVEEGDHQSCVLLEADQSVEDDSAH